MTAKRKPKTANLERLELLHSLLVEQLIAEFKFYQENEIPMSAADKNVILTLLRQEQITATPDSEDIKALREYAEGCKDEARAQVANELLAEVDKLVTDDVHQFLT